jgi:hypothetical protein
MQIMQFYNNRTTEDKDDLARSFSAHNLCHYLKLRKLLPGRDDHTTRPLGRVRLFIRKRLSSNGVTLYRQPNLTRYITPFPRFSHYSYVNFTY